MTPRRAAWDLGLAASLLLAASGCAREQGPRPQLEPNPPSRGVIDKPAPGERVGPAIVIAGWVVDESGVDRVRIYVDDRLAASVRVTRPRPDVEAVFPEFARPGAIHGWHAAVDFGDHVGYVRVHAEALDARGALTRFADVTVLVDP